MNKSGANSQKGSKAQLGRIDTKLVIYKLMHYGLLEEIKDKEKSNMWDGQKVRKQDTKVLKEV